MIPIYLASGINDRLHLKRNGKRSGCLQYRKWDANAEMVLNYAGEITPENMPKNRTEWPDPKMIEEGNRWRGIGK